MPEVGRFAGAGWDRGAPWDKVGNVTWAAPGVNTASLMRLVREDSPDVQPLDIILAAFPFTGFPLPVSMRNAILAWSSRHPDEWSTLYPHTLSLLGPNWLHPSAAEAADTQTSAREVGKGEEQQ